MPIYMDVHIVPGVKAKDVAEAHQKDLFHQHEFGCKCLTYWIDEQRENIFCLIEAPDKQMVEEMHNRAHGLVPNKVIEVNSGLVESFLGRIYDPADAEVTAEGLKVFADPSFRVLVVATGADPVLLRYTLGEERARELLGMNSEVIRGRLREHGGREVEHGGDEFIISFTSASRAVACALAIHREMPTENIQASGFRLAVNAGEPIQNSNKLFGDTIKLAKCLCAISGNTRVALSSNVKELIARDYYQSVSNNLTSLSPQDENCLVSLFTILEDNWQKAEFDIPEYCQTMAMSKSQLYRKTISLTGLSPNILLKDYRLEKARELMRKQRYSIAQITFESGFTSPSYFTKCFKKKFGLLPMAYLDLLH